jgi:hypothetical protein
LSSEDARLAYRDEKAYDGMVIVSRSFVKQMIRNVPSKVRRHQLYRMLASGELTSGNFRILCPEGLIKGDCIIVDDDIMAKKFGHGYAIVTHECNVKAEKGAKFFHATLNPYHQNYYQSIGEQPLSWGLGFLVGEKRLEQDFLAMVDEFRQAMKSGQYPDHMLRTAPMSDDGVLTSVGYAEVLRDSAMRYLSCGLSLNTSSYLVGRIAHGFLNKLKKDISRLALPMPWAAGVSVISHAVLELAGFDLSEYDLNKAFWHAPTGRFSYPTEKFIEFYPRHGGWDQDDKVIAALRVMKEESGEYIAQDNESYTIRALSLRSPNGLTYFGADSLPGEYSVVDIDLHMRLVDCGFIMLYVPDFPLYNVWHSIPLLDMTKAPKITHHQVIDHDELPHDEHREVDTKTLKRVDALLAKAESTNFPAEAESLRAKAAELTAKATVAPYSPEDAVRQFDLALENPGIGSIINPLIAYNAMFGTYPKRLPAALEQMVDALEQTPDHAAFEVIEEAKKEILKAIIDSGLPIDRTIAVHRLSQKVRDKLGRGRIVVGPFTRLIEMMTTTYNSFHEELLGDPGRRVPLLGLDITNRQVITELMDVEVAPDVMKVAGEVFRKFGAEKGRVPGFRTRKDQASGLTFIVPDAWVSYARRRFFISLHDQLLAKILESGVDPAMVMVGIYKMVIKHKVKDDVVFQVGDIASDLDGQVSMLDLFLSAYCRIMEQKK